MNMTILSQQHPRRSQPSSGFPSADWLETITSEPDSLWRDTFGKAASFGGDLPSHTKWDVAIIGGGITGISAALHLAEKGIQCVLLEAGTVGSGASGRSNGQVIAGLKLNPVVLYDNFGLDRGARFARFAGSTADYLFALIDRFGISCRLQRTGWLQPASDNKKLHTVYERARAWQEAIGVSLQFVDAAEVSRLTGAAGYVGGWIDPRNGQLDPLQFVHGMASAAKSLGTKIHERCPVFAIRRISGAWELETSLGVVGAQSVIVATNAYTGKLIPRLGRSIIPATSVQIASAPLTARQRAEILPSGLPVSDAKRLLNYLRISPDGRLVFGGRGSFSYRYPPKALTRLRQQAARMFPAAAGLEWTHGWGGAVALTADFLPHLHKVEENLFAGLGYNGSGIAMATSFGRDLARLATGVRAEELDVPVTVLDPIPLHAFRRPALEALAIWYRMLDRIGR
nr:FAD-dependent oxidoreductase [Mesorhizobium sp. WSM4875]